MHVVHVIASINRNTGGPAYTVARLCEELACSGASVSLATLSYPTLGPQIPVRNVKLVGLQAGRLTTALRGWSPALRRLLAAQATQGADVIHGHGMWMFPNLYARQVAVQARKPLVISPRGTVDSWALSRSRAKKTLAWYLAESRNMRSAAAFHATSRQEADAIRALGLRQPIAVIPNGVDVPSVDCVPQRSVLEDRFPELREKRWLLFMSRLDPKKGVLELLQAWNALEHSFPQWHLLIAGPDLDGYGVSVLRHVIGMNLSSRITFSGMLTGIDKACALGHAELFVLPTRSENFGVAVAEALAYGVPVITTKAAPWQELDSEGSGWWIDLDEQALRSTLAGAMACSRGDLQAMGARGRQLVQAGYAWKAVGEQMAEFYAWLLGQGGTPACVGLS